MSQEIYQKQFSIGRLLSEAWKIFIENFKLILFITLIVYIPLSIIFSFFPNENAVQGIKIYSYLITIIEALIGVVATMAITLIAKNKIDGKIISLQEAFNKALASWWTVIKTNIILFLLIVGLTLLLIVPGIIFSVYWIFVTQIVILNNKSGQAALNYSKSIVKGRWWLVAIYSIVFAIIFLIVNMIIEFILAVSLGNNIFSLIIVRIVSYIIASFFTVVTAIFYINFEANKPVLANTTAVNTPKAGS